MKNGFTLFVIVLVLLVFGAGCTAPEKPAPSLPVTETMPAFQPPIKNPLGSYAFSESDIPFKVSSSTLASPGRSSIPATVSRYGVTFAYLAEFYELSDTSKTSRNVRQVLCKVPEENVTVAFADFRNMLGSESGTTSLKRKVVKQPGMQVGDESEAFSIHYNDSVTHEYPDSVIVFRKGNVIEAITLKSPEQDFTTLMKLAQKAESLIP